MAEAKREARAAPSAFCPTPTTHTHQAISAEQLLQGANVNVLVKVPEVNLVVLCALRVALEIMEGIGDLSRVAVACAVLLLHRCKPLGLRHGSLAHQDG